MEGRQTRLRSGRIRPEPLRQVLQPRILRRVSRQSPLPRRRLFDDPDRDPYHAYVFLRDLKMLEALETDAETDTVHFHPERLYPDIDLAETLSHLRGKWIKGITAETVTFEDGETMRLDDPDWETLKPMVWWG